MRRTETEPSPSSLGLKPRITVFHCCNAASDVASGNGSCEIKSVKMPCSSASREVFFLRAFEAGADAVVVLVCPEGKCAHVNGILRAARRVERVKRLVNDIGLDGRRLSIHNVAPGDRSAAERVVRQTVEELAVLGRNPAA